MNYLKAFFSSFNKRTKLLIVVAAVILIELVSAVQYYKTYQLMESELEKRAESELTMKTILIKSTLNSAEDILENHLWDIRRCLVQPDSVSKSVIRLVKMNRYVCGGFMTFVPYYYPEKGRLFEPYAQVKSADNIDLYQIADSIHDYTERDFYKLAIASEKAIWVDPYVDNEGAQTVVTSYVTAIRDGSNALVGVVGIDVSLSWLGDTIDARHIYPSSFNLLLTEDGKTIAKPSGKNTSQATSDEIVRLINDSTVARKLSRSGRSTIKRFKTRGQKGTVFYANMRGNPHWQIAVVCYDKEVYGSLNRLRLHMGGLMLLAFGVLLFLIWNIMRKERQLNKKNLEQERMCSELRIASNIQQSMMNMNDPVLTNTKDLSAWGVQIPAKEVGGDLYIAFIRDEKLFFCIGDVSGKGVPSALIMAVTQSLFRNIASRENNPVQIMTQLNEAACRNNKANIFATLFVGVLDLPSGHLRFCNAGHERPVLIKKEKNNAASQEGAVMECKMLEIKPNLPIGLFDDFIYEMEGINLEKGTALFFYTDGLTEGRNPMNVQFGKERMMQVLANSDTLAPQQLVENMIKEQSRFVQTAEQRDDLTLLALCYSPEEEHNLLDEEIILQNDVTQVTTLNTFIKEILQRLSVSKPLAYKIRLALEEAVVNVMKYAYPVGIPGDIRVRVASNGKRLTFIIIDTGVAFNPTEAVAVDTSLSAEDRPIGGLGILLVRKQMDSINYERTDGKNVLTLRKDYVVGTAQATDNA